VSSQIQYYHASILTILKKFDHALNRFDTVQEETRTDRQTQIIAVANTALT